MKRWKKRLLLSIGNENVKNEPYPTKYLTKGTIISILSIKIEIEFISVIIVFYQKS